MKKIHVTTLGCPKNLVDSENLMGLLRLNRFSLCDNPEESDILIINTCGFINDAKEESIQAILEALELKKQDPAKKVFVAGCLSQRYRKELEYEMPEVDAIFGTEEYQAILQNIGSRHMAVDNIYRYRKLTTPRHYAYLKISEGCNHTCAFCAIPAIRGKHRSRPLEEIVEEAEKLVANGARELILVSQDTSYYGRDLYQRVAIAELIEKLENIENLAWIRVLYWYPTNFPMEILEIMQGRGKLLPYLDLPIQHISDHVLRLMRRGDTRDSIIRLFEIARQLVPDIALRTTVIVGHPGEKKRDFEELLEFVNQVSFDRLGSFVYSDEEGTASFLLPHKVGDKTARKRQQVLMKLQQEISFEKNQKLVGSIQRVLIDSYDSQSRIYVGRTYRDAPEIDNEVIIPQAKATHLNVGEFYDIRIEEASEFELYGNPV